MSAVGQSNPFSDASEYNSLSFIIARALDEMQTVSIVEVKAVDTVKLTVDVQVLVNLVTGANISVPHGVISARPYYRAQGGTSGIILDPVVGDIGVMVFAARDSSAVVAAKGLANPGSQRRFSWSDGMYFGGVLNATPTQYLKFAGGGITLLSPTAINIQSPANKVTGPLEVTGVATFDTDVHILGSLFLTGVLHGSSAIFSGNVTAASFTGGGGGGGGTVTSVGISTPGAGVVVGGGPVTTAGTLTVDLSSTTYAALALAVTALQSISIATGTGLTGGPLHASGSTVALSAATIASLLPGSPVQGDIAYYNGAAWALLAPGTAGYVLQTNGAAANPTWVAAGTPSTPVPATISDLTFWWESDNILATAGQPLTRLQERTPWIGGIAAANPLSGVSVDATLLNSLPVLVWPAAAASGTYPMPTGFYLPGGCTVFLVAKGSTSAGNQAVFGGNGANGALCLYLGVGSANIALVSGGLAIIGPSSATWTVGTFFQANVTYNSASGAYAYRQSQAAANSGTGATGAGVSVATAVFGDDNTGAGSARLNAASLAAVIIYNRVLTGPEIAAVENYLNAKWGV